MVVRCLCLGTLASLTACTSSSSRLAPEVPLSDDTGPSDYTSSLVVPYPPPPARIETMPPAPADPACVYLDGQWIFGARDWQWQAGGWVIARDDCSFAPSRLFWHPLGADRAELRYRVGRWVQTAYPTVDCPAAMPCANANNIATDP